MAAQPLIQSFRKSPKLRQPEVVDPSPNERVEVLLDKPSQIAPAPRAKQHVQLAFEAFNRRLCHANARLAMRAERVAEKRALPGPCHSALLQVDPQLQPLFDKARNRCHHTLAAATTAYVDVTVVGIPAEAVPTSGQRFAFGFLPTIPHNTAVAVQLTLPPDGRPDSSERPICLVPEGRVELPRAQGPLDF